MIMIIIIIMVIIIIIIFNIYIAHFSNAQDVHSGPN